MTLGCPGRASRGEVPTALQGRLQATDCENPSSMTACLCENHLGREPDSILGVWGKGWMQVSRAQDHSWVSHSHQEGLTISAVGPDVKRKYESPCSKTTENLKMVQTHSEARVGQSQGRPGGLNGLLSHGTGPWFLASNFLRRPGLLSPVLRTRG